MSERMETIVVFSTYADDIFFNAQNELLETREGGPALFITRALQENGAFFDIHTGERMRVEIQLTEAGEFGRVPVLPVTNTVPAISCKIGLVSTILQEWPVGVLTCIETAFIDIQGYVRDPSTFGKKKLFIPPADFMPFCLKATEQEIQYLPPEFVEDQKQRALIITKSASGSSLFLNGTEHVFVPESVVRTKDTVGAGDTLLAHVVAEYALSGDLRKSLAIATTRIAEFLSGQQR